MVILSKKRILITISAVTVFLFTFAFGIKNTDRINKTVDTVALPVSNKVIVIDAGHGVPDERC